eukprot:TRINITY_DN5550_c0_g1_i1.p1 TRINITY_DN5550_c0_g1~~TRINITY_DN5550_c0_g1_i1.p1  ORF type:complete len:177 (-),score=42.60 TRINITY_DN5550_c0_g1_i1:57-587(-)
MGASTSNLRQEDIERMQEVSVFNSGEIKQLYKRFKRLDRLDTGQITTDDFLSIPELAMNPLVMRVIAMFTDGSDSVNFKQFIQTLSVFSTKGSDEDKIHFAFRIYDESGDGLISPDELYNVLKMMVGNNLTEMQLQQIVSKTMQEADSDGKGYINEEEFANTLGNIEWGRELSIRF